MARSFLLFSGHNDRAVVTLCRFFDQMRLPFVIVAAGRDDAIHRTHWASRVVFNRLDALVTPEWLCSLADSSEDGLVYCPTTEFINHVVLAHRDALEAAGLHIGLPDRGLYEALTGKRSSQALMVALCPDLYLPGTQPADGWRAPCVLKPKENLRHGRVLYPVLCRTPEDLTQALASGLEREAYFAQDFITGQSHYLCAYLARDGRVAAFWQTNLMQQPGGKSIVLARACANPGLDEARLFEGLHRHGYHGAFMLELIASQGRLHYIEVNPRFWGPLQLALDVCPEILRLFAMDQGIDAAHLPAIPAVPPDKAWYAWAKGAQQSGCVRHPAAQAISEDELAQRLDQHDVYARDDTRALHGQY